MASNSTSIATVKTVTAAAETGGVANATLMAAGCTVAPPGNMTSWSRASARAANYAGTITDAQYRNVMNALKNYEQTQIQASRDSEGSTGALPQ